MAMTNDEGREADGGSFVFQAVVRSRLAKSRTARMQSTGTNGQEVSKVLGVKEAGEYPKDPSPGQEQGICPGTVTQPPDQGDGQSQPGYKAGKQSQPPEGCLPHWIQKGQRARILDCVRHVDPATGDLGFAHGVADKGLPVDEGIGLRQEKDAQGEQ